MDSTGNFCYTFLIETALNESTSSASASVAAQLVALAAAAAMPIRFSLRQKKRTKLNEL